MDALLALLQTCARQLLTATSKSASPVGAFEEEPGKEKWVVRDALVGHRGHGGGYEDANAVEWKVVILTWMREIGWDEMGVYSHSFSPSICS